MSKKLGKLVKDGRTAKGWTQTQLAAKVDGLTAAEVGRIERGEKEPVQAVVREIAKALGVTQTSLVSAMSKAASGKPASAKTSSASNSMKLTAAEKKLVTLYRKADAETKKAAIDLLSGEGGSLMNLLGNLLGQKAGKKQDDQMSSMLSDMMDLLKK